MEPVCPRAQRRVAPALDSRAFAARRIPLSVLFSNGEAAGNPPFTDPAQWACRAQCGILRIN